jgi:hypothetical protein
LPSSHFKHLFSSILFLGLSLTASLAQTRIKGKIIDAETMEALPFISVQLLGTARGTTTDIDGNYTINTDLHADSLVAFYLGYKRVAKKLKGIPVQEINFVMQRNTKALHEVVIHPGENPAWRILRQVIAHKDSNNREKLTSYEYKVYNKIEFDLKDIPKTLRKWKLLSPVKFAFDHLDSTNAHEKPQLPILISETVSDYYYKSNPASKIEHIVASKLSGMEQKSISQFTGDMYLDVNVYSNNILVFGKNFISPISDNALLFYHYYLIDSLVLNGHRCYQLEFHPRRKQELLFSGNMWIADSTWAIKRLQMKIEDGANINFINQLNVTQEYEVVSGHWMLVRDHLFTDIYIPGQKTGAYGRKTATYSEIKLNVPRPPEFYSRTNNLVVAGDLNKGPAYWSQARPDSLSKTEQGIYTLVDSIQKLPLYKTWCDLVMLFAKGYKTVGNIEIGPYYSLFSANKIEGNRIRLGGRTSDKFSKWYELSGYCAYGTHDEQYKYRIGFRSFLTKTPRQLVGISYSSDYEILGQSQNAFTRDNIFSTFLQRSPFINLTSVQQMEAYYEKEWFPGFSTKLQFANRTMTPLGSFKYEYTDQEGQVVVKENIKTTELRFVGRLAWNEKYIDGTFSHISTGTKYPILKVIYTRGLKDAFQSDYAYDKLAINITDRIRFGPVGYVDYIIQAGKVFGRVPYPLLELHGGNENYLYDPYAYNMMNYYEFVSDQYLTVQAQYHFDGFFLNHIPLMRRLKWREVVSGKGLIGSVNQENKSVLNFPSTLSALNAGPYCEGGFGLENILRFFRVDALWRLSYLNRPNIAKFGLRATFQVLF